MKSTSLKQLGMNFYKWSKKNPIGKIPAGVSKEGAGENRIPFTHYANSVPVYLIFKDLLKQSKLKKGSVLDLGCGTGRNISFVKETLRTKDLNFYGIDHSRACIDYAKTQYGKQGVVFVQHGGKKLPFPNESFEYLVSSHVIEHIPKRDQALYLSEISRVLKPGGTAVIGAPNRKYCQDLFCLNPTNEKKFRLVLPHEHEHYASDIHKLFKKKGLFKKYSIWQTINPICRNLFIESTKRLKPQAGFINKIVFEVYSIARKSNLLQDLMARVGTEVLIRKMNASYEDLIKATELLKYDSPDDGDNFIVIAKK